MPRSRKVASTKTEIRFEASSGNIFKDLGFSDEEAVNLQLRGLLAIEISNIIEERGWSQRQAAQELGVSQPRIAEIMKSKIDHYSIDLLVRYLDKLGQRVSIVIEPKNEVA